MIIKNLIDNQVFTYPNNINTFPTSTVKHATRLNLGLGLFSLLQDKFKRASLSEIEYGR